MPDPTRPTSHELEVAAWRAMYEAVLEHVPRGQRERATGDAMAAAMAYCWGAPNA